VKLYVVGGRQKRDALDLEEWHRYEAAVIARLDTARGGVEVAQEFESTSDTRPLDGGSTLFKAATRAGDRLYACTQTEVLVYRLPRFERIALISLDRFNDVHHVRPRADGSLLVASTGLDCVLHVSAAGELLREWPVLPPGEARVWEAGIDYRKLATTKPHHAHPNFAFELDGKIWATRFEQRDAVCVEDFSQRIAIESERPHDGVLHDGELYFTTVDGHVVVADAAKRMVVRRFDLNAITGHGIPLGWCRGLHILARDQALVGFSRIRLTRFKDNLRWVLNRARGRDVRSLPTRVAHFDLARGALVREWSVEAAGVNALFSIHPAD
jgi:hypothetical protein